MKKTTLVDLSQGDLGSLELGSVAREGPVSLKEVADRKNWDLKIEDKLDPGIRNLVVYLRQHGFRTFNSCQGGDEHSSPTAMVSLLSDNEYPGSFYETHMRLISILLLGGYREFAINRVERYSNNSKSFDKYFTVSSLYESGIWLPAGVNSSV